MDLKKKLREWKKGLRLQDWDITAVYMHPDLMDGAGASCNICLERKHALVKIADPAILVSPDVFTNCDPEQALVHELVHIHVHPFFPEDSESLEYKLAEQAVDQIAIALVALKRGGKC